MPLVASPVLFNTPLEILEAVVAQSDAATLASWARVGKPLVPAARRSLYHTVVLNRQEDIELFLEQLCLARVSSLSSESANCSLLAYYKTIKYLDLLSLPSYRFLFYLSNAFGPSTTTSNLQLTVNGAGHATTGLYGFWVPRLLLAVRPILFHGPLMSFMDEDYTVPPLQLACYIAALPGLGSTRSHPDKVYKFSRHCKMSSIVRYCLLQLDRVRSVENLLRRLDEEGYDVASGSFDPEDAKAWIVEVRRYSALRPEKGLVGWDNVERMREWHDAVETRAVAYSTEIGDLLPHMSPGSTAWNAMISASVDLFM